MWRSLRVALVALCVLTGCKAKPDPPITASSGVPAQPPAAATTARVATNATAPLISKNTFAVISGVLSWKDPALASFSTESRRDKALHEHLESSGIDGSQLRLLLDEDASCGNILGGLRALAKRVPADGTLLFYYAGHGVKADDGKAYFACHDIDAKQSAATGLSMDAIASAIAENFHGARVLLLADCCYSGALAGVARQLRDKGIAAASVTSADESNVSTGNWTYTMSLLSCLRGDALCDSDSDGTVALSELASEVQASMKHREGQRSGFASYGLEEGTPIARVKQQVPLPKAQRRRYLDARVDGRWVPARLRSFAGKRRTLRVFGYADHRDVTLRAGETRTVTFRRYPVGSALRVYWGGKLWDAKVVRTDGDFHYISYPGWPAYWDEWITSRRIQDKRATSADDSRNDAPLFAAGSAVSVKWNGVWYPATVLAQDDGRHRIHYDGYEDSWDEWVAPQRIRKR